MNVVQKYAPYVFFNRNECHFPGEPETFRKNTRFRQSNYSGWRDRGWNKTRGRWERSNEDNPDYWGTCWKTIVKQIRKETDSLRPGGPKWCGKVTRPRDERNLWTERSLLGEGDPRGFFLELKEGFDRQNSGAEPDQPIPIFHRIDRFSVDGRKYVTIAYWFFYIINWWQFAITHEGDWEHITFYFRERDFDEGDFPTWIYFAAHNNGMLLRLHHPSIHWEEGTHLHCYVLSDGHPTYPSVPNPHEYTIRCRTWEQDIPAVDEQPWALYDGAWGEVGNSTHTTGPLGPFFKRDKARVLRSE